MIINCREVNIRFSNQNLQQQRIRALDHTGASYLQVTKDNEFITVLYMHSLGDVSTPVKALIFNKQHVVELHCEDSVTTAKEQPQ